jgi:hypothetical protein
MSLLDGLLGFRSISNDGGAPLPARKDINYIGDGVLAVDNPTTGKTDVTILSGALGVLCTALDTLVGTVDKAQIVCDGFAERNDGGGGAFVWNAGSSTARDGGTVFGTTVSGRWKRVFSGDIVDPAWYGASSLMPATTLAAIQSAVAALSVYSGIDFGSRAYNLGLRTGTTDAPLQIYLGGLQDKTLISRGATFTVQTTLQLSGYSPVIFRINNCQRVAFEGTWNFADTKAWSTYASYGQTLTPMPADWGGLSGAYPIWIQEQCSDLRFGDMRFVNTRYGIGISGVDGALPSEANRTRRISVASFHCNDVQYPLLCAENGDDLICPQLNAINCMRPISVYGASNVKISANIRNSVNGFGSIISRKKRDTSNISVDMRYRSDDGFPTKPLAISLAPVIGTGDPVVEGLYVKLACSLVTLDPLRERQYAVGIEIYQPTTEGGPIVESNYSDTLGRFGGITIELDKGRFEHYVTASPFGENALNYRKIPIKLIPMTGGGGFYNAPVSGSDPNLYLTARKLAYDSPLYYEQVSSDTVHGSYVYPIPGWAPFLDSATLPITGDHSIRWKWTRVGPYVSYDLLIVLGSTPLPAGSLYFPLPYVVDRLGQASPARFEFGSVLIEDATSPNVTYLGRLFYNGGSFLPQVKLRLLDNAGVVTHISQNMTHSAPLALVVNDTIRLSVQYTAGNAL